MIETFAGGASSRHQFHYAAEHVVPTSMQELPLKARSDGSLKDKQESFVQGSVGLRLFPATEDALSVLQKHVDATKVFLEVYAPARQARKHRRCCVITFTEAC